MDTLHLPLGCIADDFTGGTDLANNLARAGLRVVLTVGVPEVAPRDVDAIVLALKIRTIAGDEAVRQSAHAARWLHGQGARQLYFKICSTFDSTPAGNIGPVAEALRAVQGGDGVVPVLPAFPAAGRTVYQGHLFVGAQLLSESPLRHHPLTPMSDACLPRWLARQLPASAAVGLVPHEVVAQGVDAIRERLAQLGRSGCRYAVGDVLGDADLDRWARATAAHPLWVASSGLATGLAAAARPGAAMAGDWPRPQGWRAIVSGSCSSATRGQVQAFVDRGGAAWALDVQRLHDEAAVREAAATAVDWARQNRGAGAVLVHAGAEPGAVARAQHQLGPMLGARIEATLARVAAGLAADGFDQIVVAGGETSGACTQALGVHSLCIGPQIEVGVPWTLTQRERGAPLHLALKSGNFGGPDFFCRAFEVLTPA
jgi:uncharacterized protein YgbK (DUF1537 family)